jgi:hypothetical protein
MTQPTVEQVCDLYRRLTGKEPTEEDKAAVRERLAGIGR